MKLCPRLLGDCRTLGPAFTASGSVIGSPQDRHDSGGEFLRGDEVFVAFEYGHQKTQSHLSPADVSYLRTVVPDLLRLARSADDPDLVAEILSCMTYLGWHDNIEYRAAVDYLLTHQNPDGTWGDYEHHRPQFGDYVDQHVYLHTTMVTVRALIEAFESDWNVTW